MLLTISIGDIFLLQPSFKSINQSRYPKDNYKQYTENLFTPSYNSSVTTGCALLHKNKYDNQKNDD